MAHSYRMGLVTLRYQVRILVEPDICHSGCEYTAFRTVERHGVYSAVYVTVHCKESLKSFAIRVEHSPMYRKRRKAIFTHSGELEKATYY